MARPTSAAASSCLERVSRSWVRSETRRSRPPIESSNCSVIWLKVCARKPISSSLSTGATRLSSPAEIAVAVSVRLLMGKMACRMASHVRVPSKAPPTTMPAQVMICMLTRLARSSSSFCSTTTPQPFSSSWKYETQVVPY